MTGYRTWSTGDSVSASDFTSYISTQSWLIFADSSARSSAVSSPVNGMVSLLTTDNVISIYNGSAWVDAIDLDTMTVSGGNYTFTGNMTYGVDGTGVDTIWHSGTASDGMVYDASEELLTITGTNGQVALAVADGNVTMADDLSVTGNCTIQGLNMDTIVEGDVIYGSGADTLARLAKGSDDEVLTLASGVPSWAAVSGMSWSGSTANGLATYGSASTVVAESTATYDGTTLTLTQAGGGLKMDGLSSSDANCLDDYEEGTWTCTFTPGSGSITANTSEDTGYYIKIGRLVHIQGRITVSAVSTPGGHLIWAGLPFANGSDYGEGAEENSGLVEVWRLSGAMTNVGLSSQVQTNASSGIIYDGNGAPGGPGALGDKVDTGTIFMFGGAYVAAT